MNEPRDCGRILKLEKGGELFLFEACGTDIQNVETSNGVLINWRGNFAVEGGYEVDYEKLKSSVSRLEGELSATYSDEPVISLSMIYPPVPGSLHHPPGTPLGEFRIHPNTVCEPPRDILRRSTGSSYFARARFGDAGCPRAQQSTRLQPQQMSTIPRRPFLRQN